jgi:GNAT superfamily N-acetyltransferase
LHPIREPGDRVRVRRASLKDLNTLIRLFEGYRKFYRQAADRPGSRRFLKERIVRQDSVIFLARRRGRVVGFAQLYPTFSSTRLGPLWNLNDLFVLPTVRRRGVASCLLRRCQDLAKETGALGVWLETAVDNPAQSLYATHGWKLDREFLHFDWDREDHRVPRGTGGYRRAARGASRRR